MQKEGQKATRGLFLEPIRRVVSQVHAVLTISNEAVNFLDLQVCSPIFFFSSLSSNNENSPHPALSIVGKALLVKVHDGGGDQGCGHRSLARGHCGLGH